MIEDQRLPGRRLKLELLSESEITSGEHTVQSLKELLKYSDDDDITCFLTESDLSDYPQSGTEASPHFVIDPDNHSRVNMASTYPDALDLGDPSFKSCTDYLSSPLGEDEMDQFGEDFFGT